MRLLLSSLALCSLAFAQQMDDEFAKTVKDWTTKPEFMSPLVDHLPKGGAVPRPRTCSATTSERPKNSRTTPTFSRYYRTLASKSPRVKVLDIGKTDEGRECVVVFVGSEDSIKNLETYAPDIWPSSPTRARSAKPTPAPSSPKPNPSIT